MNESMETENYKIGLVTQEVPKQQISTNKQEL
jgi:hypothetical protein